MFFLLISKTTQRIIMKLTILLLFLSYTYGLQIEDCGTLEDEHESECIFSTKLSSGCNDTKKVFVDLNEKTKIIGNVVLTSKGGCYPAQMEIDAYKGSPSINVYSFDIKLIYCPLTIVFHINATINTLYLGNFIVSVDNGVTLNVKNIYVMNVLILINLILLLI